MPGYEPRVYPALDTQRSSMTSRRAPALESHRSSMTSRRMSEQDTQRSIMTSRRVPKLELLETPRSPPPKYEPTDSVRTNMTSISSRPDCTVRSFNPTSRHNSSLNDVATQRVVSLQVRNMTGSTADMEVIAHCNDRRHSRSQQMDE